jgi:hypothetical protein
MSLPNLAGLRLAADSVSTGEWVAYEAEKHAGVSEGERANTPAGKSECAISRSEFEEGEYIWRATKKEGGSDVNYDADAYWEWLQHSKGFDPATRHPLDRATMIDLLRGPPKGGDPNDRRPLIDEKLIEAQVDELLTQRGEVEAELRGLEEAQRQVRELEAASAERRRRIERAQAPPPSWIYHASAGYDGAGAGTLLSTDLTAGSPAVRWGVDAELINFINQVQADAIASETQPARWYYLEQPSAMLPENNHRGVMYEWKRGMDSDLVWPSFFLISIKLQAGSFFNASLRFALADWNVSLPQGDAQTRLRFGMLSLLFGQNLDANAVYAALHRAWFDLELRLARPNGRNDGSLSVYIRPEFMAWLCDHADRLDSGILPELRERFGQAPADGPNHGAEPPNRSLSVAMSNTIEATEAQEFWKNALIKMIGLVQGLPGWVHVHAVTREQAAARGIYVAPSPMLENRVPRIIRGRAVTPPITPWMQRRFGNEWDLAYVETLWYGRGYDTADEGSAWYAYLYSGE